MRDRNMEAGQAPEWTAIAMAIMIAVTACGGCWTPGPPDLTWLVLPTLRR